MANDEFLQYVPADYETDFTIGDVTVQGIIRVTQTGGGKTARYIAEQYRQQQISGTIEGDTRRKEDGLDGETGGADTPQGSDDGTGGGTDGGTDDGTDDGTAGGGQAQVFQPLTHEEGHEDGSTDDGTTGDGSGDGGGTGGTSGTREELEAELEEIDTRITQLETKLRENGFLPVSEREELNRLKERRTAVTAELDALGGSDGGGEGENPLGTETGPDPEIAASIEQPPIQLDVEAVCTVETYKELDGLRERTEPFSVAIGTNTYDKMGIVDLSNSRTGQSPAYRVTIKLKEHRTVYIEKPSTSSATPDQGTGGGGGGGGPFPPGGEGPVVPGGGSGRTNLSKPSFVHRNAVYGGGGSIFTAVTDPNGTGLIENVYMGASQGGESGPGGFSSHPAIFVNQGKHQGTLIIRNVHIFGYEDNAIYAENGTNKSGNDGSGRILIEDSYIHDCTGGMIRVPGGTTIRNCHIHNTNRNPPGGRGSQAFVSYYDRVAGSVTVENCHAEVTNANTRGGSATCVALTASNPPPWTFRNCQLRGSNNDSRNRATFVNCGSNPQISPPAGVPMSPQEARGGGGG